ncbi:efflux RND transporter periplasmic adaptor subunit [Desulfosarcina sp.]|uniref:efflux RND transporter periplasmic adaptor subunit n=1 Tax=Desulfosarcina sp. TaxID=2027861 RepID=UPI003565342E
MKGLNRMLRASALVVVLITLVGVFAYAALRSGPLAPIQVTAATVENQPISPGLFGIGTLEARYTYRIGPTFAGRVKRVDVQVGDMVKAGSFLGEMDPVDLDERIKAQEAALKRAQANISTARAQVQDVMATTAYAKSQARRYEQLFLEKVATTELVEAKRQELQVAEARLLAAKANLDAVVNEQVSVRADLAGLLLQRANLHLVAPVDGLVTTRDADPGTTVVAGQPVVELIDPSSMWINVRFDQLQSAGLRADLPVRIVLRSKSGSSVAGKVLRVEPMADAVTEEIMAKVVFDALPDPLPPIGELAEITVALPPLPALPVVHSPSIQRVDGLIGVWLIENNGLRFAPITPGAADLDGRIQIIKGLNPGDRVVRYSQRRLDAHSRIRVVEHLPGVVR